jgi:hypothetical protein
MASRESAREGCCCGCEACGVVIVVSLWSPFHLHGAWCAMVAPSKQKAKSKKNLNF